MTAIAPTTITRTYDRPVTHRGRIGGVQRDSYEPTRGWPRHGLGSVTRSGETEGPVPVHRQVPEYGADGKPRMESVTETLTERPYDPRARSAGCGVVAGLAAGAVAGSVCGPVGTVIGAALGGAAGAVLGRRTAEGDTVSEQWVQRPVEHPEMKGQEHWTVPIPEVRTWRDRDGERHTEITGVSGYVHHHRPVIERRQVGSYRQPTLQHSRKVGTGAAAVLAAGAGLALGLLAAALGRD